MKNKPCPPCDADQACNPASGRCVSKTGAIGKKLLGTRPAPNSKSLLNLPHEVLVEIASRMQHRNQQMFKQMAKASRNAVKSASEPMDISARARLCLGVRAAFNIAEYMSTLPDRYPLGDEIYANDALHHAKLAVAELPGGPQVSVTFPHGYWVDGVFVGNIEVEIKDIFAGSLERRPVRVRAWVQRPTSGEQNTYPEVVLCPYFEGQRLETTAVGVRIAAYNAQGYMYPRPRDPLTHGALRVLGAQGTGFGHDVPAPDRDLLVTTSAAIEKCARTLVESNNFQYTSYRRRRWPTSGPKL